MTCSRLDPEALIREFVESGEYGRVLGGVELACGSRSVAEDATQEALARLWERIQRDELPDSIAAWVTRVAMNQAKSVFRRVAVERRAERRLAPEREAVETGLAEELAAREAIQALSRRQREITILRFYLGLGVQEIAAVLKLSEGTVKKALFRARETLRSRLGSERSDEHADRER